ncbi:MAG TPA: hypothetical protein VFJ87_01565 [Rhodanobacteraceae bacterium]|jgi:hypothetical protein|nr:hypothetical protein [Rhodanobacteraceae bacterium]
MIIESLAGTDLCRFPMVQKGTALVPDGGKSHPRLAPGPHAVNAMNSKPGSGNAVAILASCSPM